MRAQLWGYWALLQRRRDFRWLWLAAVVSQAGDWFNTIATVVLVDYVRFRFPSAAWVPAMPRLDRLSQQLRSRPSFADSAPRDMPAV